MEAISKKRLRQWKRIAVQRGLDGLKSMELLDLLIEECKELDPCKELPEDPRSKITTNFRQS